MASPDVAISRYVINNDDHYSAAQKRSKTFLETAESYIAHGGEERYLPPLVREIGRMPMDEIVPFDIKQLATRLYPEHQNSTRNRQVICPVRAVFYHGHERGWAPLIRLRSFRQEAPMRKKPASQIWIHAFTRQCERDGLPHLAALVIFMSQTGARISEALRLRWEDVDFMNRTALLIKTKTDTNSTRFMTDQLIGRLYKLRETAPADAPVFRYRNRHSVNERIRAVCARADITYKPTHTCGRHAMATTAISLGVDVKSAMDAGGWKSTSVFLGTYVNARNSGRAVADRFNAYQYDANM